MTLNPSQGIYAPLPQSLSDSDSERDLHDPPTHRMTFSTHKLQQNGHHVLHPQLQHNGHIPSSRVVGKPSGFSAMSPLRKLAFCSSVALCFIVVGVFLWVLPCDHDGTCPMKIQSWKSEHAGLEFVGKVSVVRERYGGSFALVTMARKGISVNTGQSGIVALKSANGAVLWFIPHVGPHRLDCGLIDVNADGVLDCLLLGDIGLEAIDPIYGNFLWFAHNDDIVINLDFPAVISDVNNDNVYDLVSTRQQNNLHNRIVLISGMTGEILTEITVKECVDITSFMYDNSTFIYNCDNGTHSDYYAANLSDLKAPLKNPKATFQPRKVKYEHDSDDQFIIGSRRLTMQNSGKCPDCKTVLNIIDEPTQKTLYATSQESTYALKPLAFAFKATDTNVKSLKGHINGFVLKLWQWPDRLARRRRHTVPRRGPQFTKDSVSEKVVLVTFNNTDVHAINVSYTQITRLCGNMDGCQPDLGARNDSLLISDLDQDGTQELITYSSSYRCGDDGPCELFSSMEVIRLEAELPKFCTGKNNCGNGSSLVFKKYLKR